MNKIVIPSGPEPLPYSWWVGKSESDFYAFARDRFPESGAPLVDRRKVHLRGPDSPGMGERRRESRRAR